MRAVLVAGLSLALLASGAVGASGAQDRAGSGRGVQTYYVPVTQSLVVMGNGYGHGRGMSQHGAQGAALGGRTHRQILAFYYPGTTVGTHRGPLRVLVTADTTSDVVVKPARGLRVRDLATGKAVTVPKRDGILTWRITPMFKKRARTVVQYRNAEGWQRWRVLTGDGQFSADRPLRLVLPDGSSTRYRGLLRSASPYPRAKVRDTVNVVSMDDYVRGVIAREMPSSWHPQALRAQAVAARTYASFARRANKDRYWQVCDTTSCQVYGGLPAETGTTNQAVAATAGAVLRSKGRFAFTQYSASSGGWTVDGGRSYLRAKKDPWDDWSGNPNRRWRQPISVTSLEAAYPQLGRLLSIRVTRRDGNGVWKGRVLQAVLKGSAGSVSVTGDDLRWRYGLRSTWFTIRPTPIIASWRELGGRRSPLGAPVSAEAAVTGTGGAVGARQLFEKGRSFWTRAEGANPLWGPILARYRKLDGPDSRYGFPRSGVVAVKDGGTRAAFASGAILSSPRTGPHGLYGRILLAYSKRGGAAGRLGFPTDDLVKGRKRERVTFQHGRITLHRKSGELTVGFD